MAAVSAATLSRLLRGQGRVIADHDTWLAATDLQRDLALVTRNPRHFWRIPDLKILRY